MPATEGAPPSASLSSSREELTASDHGTPLFITLWDLSPPSRISSAAFSLLGLGVFHTNVWLPDLSVEWAFGGHGYAGVSGIFTLPRDSGSTRAAVDGVSRRGPSNIGAPGGSPIPGARYMASYFLGYVGETDLSRWAAPQTGSKAFLEPDVFAPPQDGRHPRHSGARLASINFALRTLAALRQDPEWHGTRYDLLHRNCNHFTDTVCRRLVGTSIPAWINRSAAIGRNIVWAVPKSLLDIQTGIDTEYDSSDHEDADLTSPADSSHPATPQHVEHRPPPSRNKETSSVTDEMRDTLQEEMWAADLAATYSASN